MKFFILDRSINVKETGSVFPQTKIVNYGDLAKNPLSSFARKKIPEAFSFPKLKIQYRAKMTDLMSESILGFPANPLISQVFYEILKKFSCPDFQEFNTIIINKKKSEVEYKTLHQYIRKNEYIDYHKTIYERNIRKFLTKYSNEFVPRPYSITKEEIQINNPEDLKRESQAKKGGIRAKFFYLNKDIIQHDHFILQNPSIWIINEKVAVALQEAKITGIAIIPLSEGKFFCN